jgi:hypothetical protein
VGDGDGDGVGLERIPSFSSGNARVTTWVSSVGIGAIPLAEPHPVRTDTEAKTAIVAINTVIKLRFFGAATEDEGRVEKRFFMVLPFLQDVTVILGDMRAGRMRFHPL